MKVALLIDGGYLRALAKLHQKTFDPDFIEKFAHKCIKKDEDLHKVLYYDAPGYSGTVRQPISGNIKNFTGSGAWLDELAVREYFAVRRGKIAFRGWLLRSSPSSVTAFRDKHFTPRLEQKGVDMRLGLDIATISYEKYVDRIILVSADTDMIPAMKHARKRGIQIVTVQLPLPNIRNQRPFILKDDLKANSDFVRDVKLP